MRRLMGVMVSVLCGATAHADQITFVAGFPPGGPSSIVARHLADSFNELLGVTSVVENRPGAAGRIASDHVRKYGADGKIVLVLASTSTLKLEPDSGLVPVGRVSHFDFVFVMKKELNAKTLAQFFEAIRGDEALQTYTTPGAGTIPHLAMVEVARREKMQLRHVPFQGSGPAQQAVLGGHVSGALFGISEVSSALAMGLQPLFVIGATRSEKLPQVPTLMELGYDIDASGWHALYVHKDAPRELVEKYNNVIQAASQKLPGALLELGFRGAPTSPEEMDALHRRDYSRWMKVATDLGIKP